MALFVSFQMFFKTSSFYLYRFGFEASLSVILNNLIDVNGTIAFQMRIIAVDLSLVL